MWPWGHVAVGYLAWSLVVRRGAARNPTNRDFWVLLVGTQFPDFVDKPLAWVLGVLPAGRSLAHSLLTASLVVVLGYALARRYRRAALGVAFGVGYFSHILADAVAPLSRGQYHAVSYLLWPLLPPPVYGNSPAIVAHLFGTTLSLVGVLQLLLLALAIVQWFHDDLPGTRWNLA